MTIPPKFVLIVVFYRTRNHYTDNALSLFRYSLFSVRLAIGVGDEACPFANQSGSASNRHWIFALDHQTNDRINIGDGGPESRKSNFN